MAVFTTMEWMEKTEKEVRVFFLEEKVAKKAVVLEVEAEEITGMGLVEVEVEEDTPGEAEEAMKMIPVGEGEVHITMDKISKMNAVTIQLVMAT